MSAGLGSRPGTRTRAGYEVVRSTAAPRLPLIEAENFRPSLTDTSCPRWTQGGARPRRRGSLRRAGHVITGFAVRWRSSRQVRAERQVSPSPSTGAPSRRGRPLFQTEDPQGGVRFWDSDPALNPFPSYGEEGAHRSAVGGRVLLSRCTDRTFQVSLGPSISRESGEGSWRARTALTPQGSSGRPSLHRR